MSAFFQQDGIGTNGNLFGVFIETQLLVGGSLLMSQRDGRFPWEDAVIDLYALFFQRLELADALHSGGGKEGGKLTVDS